MIDKALGHREEEARRIARAEKFPIVNPAKDWTSFELLDDLVTPDGTLRTCFSWEDGRFEGHVFYVKS